MKSLYTLIKKYWVSFAVYFVVGGLAAIVEWGVFYAAIKMTGTHYVIASLGGFVVATYVNYLLSSRLAFQTRGRSAKAEIFLVYLISGIGLLFNMLFMVAVVELAGLNMMAAKVGGTGVAFIWNFLARQFCVFNTSPRWTIGHLRVNRREFDEA